MALLTASMPFGLSLFFFFNDTATTEIYTLSLHDALPICLEQEPGQVAAVGLLDGGQERVEDAVLRDRESTRLNSSHMSISYAVFCLKKKKKGQVLPQTAGNGRRRCRAHCAYHVFARGSAL